MGIIGVLLATLISLPLKVIYLNALCERKILKRNPLQSIIIIFVNYLLFFMVVFLEEAFHLSTIIETNILKFLLFGILFFLVISFMTFLVNLFVCPDLLDEVKKILKIKGESCAK